MIDTITIDVPKTLVLERGHTPAKAWDDWEQKSSRRMGSWKTFIWNSYAPINGDYYPVVNGYFRPGHGNSPATNIVRVQFSAPKILFGQNLDEASEADFEKVVSGLARTLHSMGLSVSPETLREANVTICHYSKNIVLPHGITVGQTIRQLERAGVTRRLKALRVEYSNHGEGLDYGNKSHSANLYDKLSEMKGGEYTDIVRDIATMHEILRFEVRLKNGRTIRDLFKKLGLTDQITLRTVFSRTISTAVLEYYWNALFQRDEVVVGSKPQAPLQLLEAVLSLRPGLSVIRSVQYVGWDALRRDEGGLGRLRSILEHWFGTRTWYDHRRRWDQIDSIVAAWEPYEWYHSASEQILRNEALRMIAPR